MKIDLKGAVSKINKSTIAIGAIWLVLFAGSIYVEFGIVFFLISVVVFVFLNTGERMDGPSAYSLFNKDFERISGSFGTEHFEKNLRSGGPMAGFGLGQHQVAQRPAAAARPVAAAQNAKISTRENRQQMKKLKIPPNSACPCGSGKKFKKCCGDPVLLARDEEDDFDDDLSD